MYAYSTDSLLTVEEHQIVRILKKGKLIDSKITLKTKYKSMGDIIEIPLNLRERLKEMMRNNSDVFVKNEARKMLD